MVDVLFDNVLINEPHTHSPPYWGTVRVFLQKFTLEDAIGSHACSLQANMHATNGIPLGSSLLLPVCTVNCVQTLKVRVICARVWHPVGPLATHTRCLTALRMRPQPSIPMCESSHEGAERGREGGREGGGGSERERERERERESRCSVGWLGSAWQHNGCAYHRMAWQHNGCAAYHGRSS
jgi:hypothetical protein